MGNSLGYLKSTSKTKSFELFLLYLFDSNYLGFNHLNLSFGKNLNKT